MNRADIIKHAEIEYSSSPIKFTEEELDILEKHPECSCCGESIFELYDYPVVREGEVYCEDCYIDEFMSTCPVCEEHFEDDDKDEYFFITERTSEITGKPIGLYKVKHYPFYYGNIIEGFESFYDDAIEQINNFDIEKHLREKYNDPDIYVKTDFICPDCIKKYLQK